MEGIIRQYLESQTRIDECFKEKYKPELLDRCIKYIWELVKEKADKSKTTDCVAIKDEEVFKWSRDYFNDEIWKKEDEEKAKQKAKEEEDFPPMNDEDGKSLDERIAESRQKAEEYRIKKEEEERDKREHANGQMTIFDLLGG